MRSRPFLSVILLLLFAPGPLRAAAEWTQLKLGMTRDQAVAALGEPLIRSSGQDFEVWIYDERAELVFYGVLVGWSSPGAVAMTARTVDVWQVAAGAPRSEFVLARPARINSPAVRRAASTDDGFRLPTYRRRS